MNNYSCGFIAIIGRPNVGKSTLLNRIIGEKISITSPRAQTTRHRILGIKTREFTQVIFVDTPGIHRQARKALNQQMNKLALNSILDVDIVLWMLEGDRWQDEDDLINEQIQRCGKPLIIVINKIDLIHDKQKLLPHIELVREKTHCDVIVPLSAKNERVFDRLEQEIIQRLSPSEALLYPDDMNTDRDWQFRAGEMIREKLTRLLRDELPYSVNVEIEKYTEHETLIEIHAIIWVDRESHKAIVIGNKGSQLKQIATQARIDLERLLDRKVMLHCWVKTKSGWSDDIDRKSVV